MISRTRLPLGAAGVVGATAVLALAGCGVQDGLAAGESAPPVAVQPSPEPVWSAWSGPSAKSPAADAAARQSPPRPLKGVEVPAGGLGRLSVREVLGADPRIKRYADRKSIREPGRAGVRPPGLVDLTGDGTPELLVAVDTENGSTVVAAYRGQSGRVVPILLARGRGVTVERVGTDLVLRQPCADGAEQAVRYRWNGQRMTTLSDTKTYPKSPEPYETPETSETSETSDTYESSEPSESSESAEPTEPAPSPKSHKPLKPLTSPEASRASGSAAPSPEESSVVTDGDW